jgi:hypothetical protein
MASQDGGNMKICPQCNNSFLEPRQTKNKIYCSPQCTRESNPKNTLTVHRKDVGAYSELIVCSDLLKRGYEVYRSISQHCSGDLMIEKDGIIKKVEVRTCKHNKGGSLAYVKSNIRAEIVALNFSDTPDGIPMVMYLKDDVPSDM